MRSNRETNGRTSALDESQYWNGIQNEQSFEPGGSYWNMFGNSEGSWSNNKEQMKIKAIIEMASDGSFSIYHDSEGLDFLVTGTGKTLDEAKNDFLTGFSEIRAYRMSQGLNTEDVEWVWCYDTASFIREYAYAFTLAGLSRITGVNQGILSHYANGTSRPSDKTRQKIQDGIRKFADTLSKVDFC